MDKVKQIINILPKRIKKIIGEFSKEEFDRFQEIRLRAERPVVIIINGTSYFINSNFKLTAFLPDNPVKVSFEEVTESFNNACGYSVHSHLKSISAGYVTLSTGDRVGIAGEAICEDDKIIGVKNISSLNIRIAREHKNSAEEIMKYIYTGSLNSIIVAGEPLSGKTTMLRDIARRLSGENLSKYYKTVIVDERNEISGSNGGKYNNDLGMNTDVLTGYPKKEGIICALRSLSPDIIICDEVGDIEEVSAIEQGLNCGVKFIVSVHASSRDELILRPQIRRLIKSGCFDKIVLLNNAARPCTINKIFEAGKMNDEINRFTSDDNIFLSDRQFYFS